MIKMRMKFNMEFDFHKIVLDKNFQTKVIYVHIIIISFIAHKLYVLVNMIIKMSYSNNQVLC